MTDAIKSQLGGNATVSYHPVVEGDFHSYDRWVLRGLYSYATQYYGRFPKVGGRIDLEEKHWTEGPHAAILWTSAASTATVGNFVFSAWTLERSYYGAPATYPREKAILVQDFPIPISLQSSSAEYALTALQLR